MAPECDIEAMISWVEKSVNSLENVPNNDNLDEHRGARELSLPLGQLLAKCTAGSPKLMAKKAGTRHGWAGWWAIADWYAPRTTQDRTAALTRIMNPPRCG